MADVKPVIIAPLYRDGIYFAAGRLGRNAREVDIVLGPDKLRGRNLAEVPVYFLQGNWARWRDYEELKEYAITRGAKIQWRTL